MKINKIISTILACSIMTACGDKLADLNENPNASLTAGNGLETLTAGQAYYGVALEAYFNEYNSLMAQYWAGGPGVALIDAERYFVEPLDFNNEWSFCYLNALSDLRYTIDNGNPALAAVADIYSVMIFQVLVDHFGDIPYFDALKGDPESGEILTPGYDDAQAIYNDLIVRLDASLAVLTDPNIAPTSVVGFEDIVYDGDIPSWVAYANSLKLKILMRQSVANPSGVSADVVSLIASGGPFLTTNARIPFAGGGSSNWNPQFARRSGGVGQFYIASNATVNEMTRLLDPRGLVLYNPAAATGTFVGVDQGNVQDIGTVAAADFSYPSAVAYGATNDVILMSTWEVMFLRAEAALRFGTADDAQTMYEAAIDAHFAHIGAAGAAAYYGIAGHPDVVWDAAGSEDENSDRIGRQKWISMNGLQETEGWIESRRFDKAPSNIFTNGIFQTPTRSVFGAGVFPSKRVYPQTELSFNAGNVPTTGATLTDKVFWDN